MTFWRFSIPSVTTGAAWMVKHAWLVYLGLQASDMAGIHVSAEVAGTIGAVTLFLILVVVVDWAFDGFDDQVVDS